MSDLKSLQIVAELSDLEHSGKTRGVFQGGFNQDYTETQL